MLKTKYNYIYKTTNLINGKIYIGQHCVNKRPEIDDYLGSGNYLKRAIKKYGKENFKREILEFCLPCVNHINFKEQYWIKELNSTDKEIGYNVSKGGDISGYSRGMVRSEEHCRRLSESKKGHEVSEETKEKLRQANLGKKASEETKRKQSESNKKYVPSQETKEKLRQVGLGHEVSSETRKKISESNKGKVAWNKGKESVFLGKTHTEESKKKMSEYVRNRSVLECPYCNIQCNIISVMKKHHFDNCKHKPKEL
jgi:group I intron endonuclease